MTFQPDHIQFRRHHPSAERQAPTGDGRPTKPSGPKPAQAYCRLCERLFAYFQTTKRRQFCNACVEIERRAALVFSNEQQRRARLAARENAILCHEVVSA